MTNEYGLDTSYFESLIQREFGRGLCNYTPEEFARVCLRMAKTASEETFLENEFILPSVVKQIKESTFKEAKIPETAKYKMIGEFSVVRDAVCHECYSGSPSEDCEVCGGEELFIESIDIPWATQKDIFKKFCECAVEEMK